MESSANAGTAGTRLRGDAGLGDFRRIASTVDIRRLGDSDLEDASTFAAHMSATESRLVDLVPLSDHRTLAERAFAVLHHAIVSGRLEPGRRLALEVVAAELAMSAMPIREALRRLDSVGLVETVPHRGARVAQLSIDDLRGVYEARLALEPVAVRHAAERRSAEDLELASERLKGLELVMSSDGDGRWKAHTEFHFSLYRAARSRWLLRLITPLWDSSERYRVHAGSPVRLDMRQREHEAIWDAVAAAQPERAAALLHNHLATTANMLARQLGGEELFSLDPRGDGLP